MLRLFTGVLLVLLAAPLAHAQFARPEGTVYFVPRVGLSNYIGDLDSEFDFDEWGVGSKVPLYAGLEVGYQFSPLLAFGVTAGALDLPTTAGPDVPATFGGVEPGRGAFEDETTIAFPFALIARAQSGRRFAPFLEAGIGGAVTTYRDAGGEQTGLAWGPQLGIGADVYLSRTVALTLAVQTLLAFPDEAIDGDEWWRSRFGSAGSNGLIGSVAPFDAVTALSIGLKVNARGAPIAPRVLALAGPDTLLVGQVGTYQADVTDDAAGPIVQRWSWRGGEVQGREAQIAFAEPGRYDVRFEATNRAGAAEGAIETVVVSPPVSPRVLAASGSPEPSEPGQAVAFSARAEGSGPLNYRWAFGDGSTSSEAQPSHVYAEPGTYAVRVRVTSPGGEAEQALSHRVIALYDACADVVELASVSFARQSSALSVDARAALVDNLRILIDCPSLNVEAIGYASPREHRTNALSLDRAQAVADFYRSGGVDSARIGATGRGATSGFTSKKEDGASSRRADSVPSASRTFN